MPALIIKEDLSTERDSNKVIQTLASTEKAKTDSKEELDNNTLQYYNNIGRIHYLKTYRNCNKELVKKIKIAEAENFLEKPNLSYAKSIRFIENSMPHYSIKEMYNN
jgi:hypothetical protein